jgi:hypothetical protein
MKRLRLLVIVLACMVAEFPGQTAQIQGSPKEVVEKYLKMVEDGELLTADGWNKVSAIFSEPSPQPKDKVIFVTSQHHGVGERWVNESRAEVQDGWWDPLGSIDSALRYTPPAKSNSEGNIGVYHLALTDKHWEPEPNGQMKEVTGSLHWEIEGPLTWRWTTVEPAMRYVADMSEKSSDPAIKHNAERTIAILKSHLR